LVVHKAAMLHIYSCALSPCLRPTLCCTGSIHRFGGHQTHLRCTRVHSLATGQTRAKTQAQAHTMHVACVPFSTWWSLNSQTLVNLWRCPCILSLHAHVLLHPLFSILQRFIVRALF